MDLNNSHQLLASLFASGKEVTYERRDIILEYNLDSQIVCQVVEGYVKVFSYTGNGNERIHFLYTAGDVFPLSSLLSVEREEVGFMALTQVRIRVKPIKDILRGMESNPSVMLALLEQQANLYGLIVNLHLGSAEQRLAHRLLSLGKRFGVENGDHLVINLPLTIQELADMVRLTRETTGKVLSQFEQHGYIILGRQQILIYPEELKLVVDAPLATQT